MDLQLNGKTALITGASRGIGRAIALELAREGAYVAVTARRKNLLDELAKEIERAGGNSPTWWCSSLRRSPATSPAP